MSTFDDMLEKNSYFYEPDPQREMVLYTSETHYRRVNCSFTLAFLRQYNFITPEEIKSIQAMLASEDLENLTVAEGVLEHLRLSQGAGMDVPKYMKELNNKKDDKK